MNLGDAGGAPKFMETSPRRIMGSRWWALATALVGAALGAAYAHFIGCRTGTCPITSSVWTAAVYGGVFGALIGWPG